MEEVWRNINNYEVSTTGRVRNPRTGKIVNPRKDKYGYLVVGLYKDGVRKFCKVHRLVAQAFLPNPDGLPIVNHKDENKENNRVDNLEWCNDKYSINYGTRNEKVSKSMTNGKRSKTVYQYTLDGQLVKVWPSAMECGREGLSQGHISACCRGEEKAYKSFRWSYILL